MIMIKIKIVVTNNFFMNMMYEFKMEKYTDAYLR